MVHELGCSTKFTFVLSGSAAEGEESTKFSMYPKPSNKMETERNNPVQFSTNISESQLPLPPKGGRTSGHDRDFELFKSCNPTQNMTHSTNMVKDPNPLKHIQPIGHRDAQPGLSSIDQRVDASKDLRFTESGRLVPGKPSKEFTFDVDDLDIPWNDLVLKEKIGAGICFLLLEEIFGVKSCIYYYYGWAA